MENLQYKHAALQATLKQVSNYYIEPCRDSGPTNTGISNSVIVNWKKNRIEELKSEILELVDLIERENAVT